MNGHLIFHMENSIEQYKSFIGYNGVNLLSDVGGTLGLFLGWSIALCTDYIINLLQNKTMRSCVTSTIAMILLIGFLQWSTPVFEKFMDEDETVEFQTVQGYTSPYVTFCPREKYHAWLEQTGCPLYDELYDDFYQMVSTAYNFLGWMIILQCHHQSFSSSLPLTHCFL